MSKSLLCAMPTHGSDVRERDLAVGMHRQCTSLPTANTRGAHLVLIFNVDMCPLDVSNATTTTNNNNRLFKMTRPHLNT